MCPKTISAFMAPYPAHSRSLARLSRNAWSSLFPNSSSTDSLVSERIGLSVRCPRCQEQRSDTRLEQLHSHSPRQMRRHCLPFSVSLPVSKS
jgi:hypothetical protein